MNMHISAITYIR